MKEIGNLKFLTQSHCFIIRKIILKYFNISVNRLKVVIAPNFKSNFIYAF